MVTFPIQAPAPDPPSVTLQDVLNGMAYYQQMQAAQQKTAATAAAAQAQLNADTATANQAANVWKTTLANDEGALAAANLADTEAKVGLSTALGDLDLVWNDYKAFGGAPGPATGDTGQ